jgi:hypothetical protein
LLIYTVVIYFLINVILLIMLPSAQHGAIKAQRSALGVRFPLAAQTSESYLPGFFVANAGY